MSQEYSLTLPETYQILNLLPKSEIIIQLIIPDIYERLTEEQIANLLEGISNCFTQWIDLGVFLSHYIFEYSNNNV